MQLILHFSYFIVKRSLISGIIDIIDILNINGNNLLFFLLLGSFEVDEDAVPFPEP